MPGIDAWSSTAANNNAAAPNGAPTGMFANTVDDTLRQIMASTRAWFEDAQWINWGHSPAYAAATQFTVAGDKTAIYTVNRRVKIVATTPGTIYGYVSASSYSAPNTTVTVAFDSGSLSSEALAVYVSMIDELGKAIPGLYMKGTNNLSEVASAATSFRNLAAGIMTTRGDLVTRDASQAVRLAVGAANSILKSDGTDPSWATISAMLDAVIGSTRGMLAVRGAATWGSLAVGAANTIKASDGADVVNATLTELIDAAIGSTRGSVLYRGAAGWAILTPGTSGHALLSQGAGADPVYGAVTSKLVQRVYATYATYASTSSTVPDDDTIPQNTEGAETVTCSITPTSGSNRLRVTYGANMRGTGNMHAAASLFRDSGADALDTFAIGSAGGTLGSGSKTFEEAAPGTGTYTYKVRVGMNAGEGTTSYFNGNASARRYGGMLDHFIIIDEITP